MGAWNSSAFGNDTAADWLGDLQEAKGEAIFTSVFELVLNATTEFDAPLCEKAIAAAAVVEATRRQPVGKLPPETKQWISERGFVPSNTLVERAIAAVRKIREGSELRDLWAESSSPTKWLKQIDLLLAALRQVQSLTPPTRTPKAPPAPRRLDKMIEKINPAEQSPLRRRLRQKLAELDDVNAPIPGTLEETPLDFLAAQGLIPEAELLFEKGAKINPVLADSLNMRTPLQAACANGRADMAKWLLEHGAQIYLDETIEVFVTHTKLEPRRLEPRTFSLPKALWNAIRSGSIATVEVLIRHGAKLETGDCAKKFKGHLGYETLLHMAVEAGKLQMIEFLVKNGVPLEAKNSRGETACHSAAVALAREPLSKLIALGANPNAKNDKGQTALDVLEEPPSDKEVARLLRKLGGRKASEL